jgi:hypothetical protein
MSQIARVHGTPWNDTCQDQYNKELRNSGDITGSPDTDTNGYLDAEEMTKHYRSLNESSQKVFISFVAKMVVQQVSQDDMQTVMFLNDLYATNRSLYQSLKLEVKKYGIKYLDMHVGQAIQDNLDSRGKRDAEYLKMLENCEATFDKAQEIISGGKRIGYLFYGSTKDEKGESYTLCVNHIFMDTPLLFVNIWKSKDPSEISRFNICLLLREENPDITLLERKFPRIFKALMDFRGKNKISY